MKDKTFFVLWSGGLDSTYLIQHLLETYPKSHVYSGYVEILNNESKTVTELKAIKTLERKFNEYYDNRLHHLGTVYKCKVEYIGQWMGLRQLPVWITAIVSSSPTVDEIAIGYVMNDCAISYLSEIQNVISAWRKGFAENFPKVTFPLTKHSKDDIVNRLHLEFKQHVVWCENPKCWTTESSAEPVYIPCEKCEPCKRSPLINERVNKIEEEKEKRLYQLSQLEFTEILVPTKYDQGVLKCIG